MSEPQTTEQALAKLTPRQRRFVAEYAVDMNGAQAAVRAGYSEKTADRQGSRLLKRAEVAAAVQAEEERRLREAGVRADAVLREAAALATFDLGQLYDAAGKLLPVKAWPETARKAVSAIEQVRGNVDKGDGQFDDVVRVKLWDKTRALELLARHLGLLVEKQQVQGTIELTWRPPLPPGVVVEGEVVEQKALSD